HAGRGRGRRGRRHRGRGRLARVGSPYIRPFEPRDREAVADICVRTAQHGEDARGHLASPELYAEIWALPYVDLAPELAFVLDAGDGSHRAIGYVLGVEDTASCRERAEREWEVGR